MRNVQEIGHPCLECGTAANLPGAAAAQYNGSTFDEWNATILPGSAMDVKDGKHLKT